MTFSSHAKERLLQRYNLNAKDKNCYKLFEKIKNGDRIDIAYDAESDRVISYLIWENLPLKIVWTSKNIEEEICLITMLPLDVDEYNRLIDEDRDPIDDYIENFMKILDKSTNHQIGV